MSRSSNVWSLAWLVAPKKTTVWAVGPSLPRVTSCRRSRFRRAVKSVTMGTPPMAVSDSGALGVTKRVRRVPTKASKEIDTFVRRARQLTVSTILSIWSVCRSVRLVRTKLRVTCAKSALMIAAPALTRTFAPVANRIARFRFCSEMSASRPAQKVLAPLLACVYNANCLALNAPRVPKFAQHVIRGTDRVSSTGPTAFRSAPKDSSQISLKWSVKGVLRAVSNAIRMTKEYA